MPSPKEIERIHCLRECCQQKTGWFWPNDHRPISSCTLFKAMIEAPSCTEPLSHSAVVSLPCTLCHLHSFPSKLHITCLGILILLDGGLKWDSFSICRIGGSETLHRKVAVLDALDTICLTKLTENWNWFITLYTVCALNLNTCSRWKHADFHYFQFFLLDS